MRNSSIAQCIGLWLAEGSVNSIAEITFTNNQYSLIRFFHKTLSNTFFFENKPRIYVYSDSKNPELDFLLHDVLHRFYVDKRANRPYFIYRVSGRKLVKDWLRTLGNLVKKRELYVDIIQGFFAGEGNIKYIERTKSRVVRIAQGKRNELIEDILNYLGVKFSYSSIERSYIISNRKNLTKLVEIDISKLHPEKRQKLNYMFGTYQQNHYPKGQIKKMLLEIIQGKPETSYELSKILERSHARITKVLIQLKKMGKANDYRVGSLSYWTADKGIIIISNRKKMILDIIGEPKRLSEISRLMKINSKAAFRRLKELEKLNLVRKYNDLWYKLPVDKEVIVYRIRNRDR